jgi:pyrroline-5-carboxylate reductase
MKIAIIGCGKMGSALARGIARKRGAQLVLCDHDNRRAAGLAKEIGAKAAKSAKEAARGAQIVIIAVKPDAVEPVLDEIRTETAGKCVISIAAGIPLAYLRKRLPKSCEIAVAMPSLAAEAGRGATMFYAKAPKARKAVQQAFVGTGILVEAKQEKLMDCAFLHSSGMAFFFSAIDAMARAGEKHGMKYDDALLLAAKSAECAGALVLGKKARPLELEAMVATKKGITLSGLEALRKARTAKGFFSAGDAVIREAERRRRRNK